jgi:hypothetical protein
MNEASRVAGASRGHDTHQLHAKAPGLVGWTIEQTPEARCRMRLLLADAKTPTAECG